MSFCAHQSLKIYFILFHIFLFYSCAPLKFVISEKKPLAPQLEFEDAVYDFEFAGPKQDVTHSFKFKNSGGIPLIIDNIVPDCGCSSTLSPGKEIPPGGTGEVIVDCITQRYMGKQEKQILVFSNDPQNSEISLTISGVIKRDIVIIPKHINYGEIKKGKVASRRIKIMQLSIKRLVINKIEADEKYFEIKKTYFSSENSKGIEIEIALKPSVPVGKFTDVITLHTNLKRKPRIDVVVLAVVK